MKRLASVSFTTTDIDPPAGVTVAGFDVTLFLAGVPVGSPVPVADTTAKVSFTIIAPGSYHVEGARVAQSGEAIASPAASEPFVVSADKIAVPLTVTVTLSDVPVSTLPPVPSSPPPPGTSMAASAPPAKGPEPDGLAIPPAK